MNISHVIQSKSQGVATFQSRPPGLDGTFHRSLDLCEIDVGQQKQLN